MVRFFHYSRRVHRALVVVSVAALLAAGCGVRNSKPFTASASAPCFRQHGFTGVTTKPADVGFIAGFADNGGLRATSPSGNVVTVAFTADPDSVDSTEAAFRAHATGAYKTHISDVMEANRNAVLVWAITPKSDELDAAQRCLRA
jgi:hypothetical protein